MKNIKFLFATTTIQEANLMLPSQEEMRLPYSSVYCIDEGKHKREKGLEKSLLGNRHGNEL